jgi:hypothetical protein
MRKSAKNTCQHTRAIQLDRRRRQPAPPPDGAIEQRFTALIHPATLNQVAHFHALGLRERTLTLPVMMAFVVSLIWRGLGSVAEAVRLLSDEGLLWSSALRVRQQSVSERLRVLPSEIFERVFEEVLPKLQERWRQRVRRLEPVLGWAGEHFAAVLVADASTLDALVKKLHLLRSSTKTPLAGKICALLDVLSQQPRAIWYESDAAMSEQRFWDRLIEQIAAETLLLVDMGFSNYQRFAELSRKSIWLITRAKRDTAYSVLTVLEASANVRDTIIELGRGKHRCGEPLRLVEVRWRGIWYRYITNLLDVERLPALHVAALYRERWSIEDAFAIVKRLLGLAYFYSSSSNAIAVQVWTTWLLYAVLVDLGDELADRLHLPLDAVSLEMLYRALYHYTQARYRGQADDPLAYLAEHAQRLGIIKRPKKKKPKRIPLLTRLVDA